MPTRSATLPHSPARAIADSLVGPELPLSWARGGVDAPALTVRRLPLSRLSWVAYADLPACYSFEQLYGDWLADLPGAMIRGCGPALAGFLSRQGWATARAGVEALVDLDGEGMRRRAVTKMVKQARRHGAAREIPWSQEGARLLRAFAARARYGGRPQLHDLFRSEFVPGTRLFVFDRDDGAWQGAILISSPSPMAAVTELMLRAPDAPGGVMESLFVFAGAQLREEGVRRLSLNEAPFYHLDDSDLRPGERLISAVGQSLRYVYNAEGLLRFKAKFAPQWRPVYLCARPRLSLLVLAELFAASGCLRLALG
nr:phosphatidylglycerol lysyltransferase domain-containing protein [Oscillochloris sp. ZM17-4]